MEFYIGKPVNRFSFGVKLDHSFGYGGWHFGIWYCQDGFVSFDFIKVSLRIGRGF